MSTFVQLTLESSDVIWVSAETILTFSASAGITTVELKSGAALRVTETPVQILAQVPTPVQSAMLTDSTMVTASVNEITVSQTWHTVSVPAGVASVRHVNIIHGGVKGAMLVLQKDPTSAGDPIINTIGNIKLSSSFTLNTLTDTVVLMHDGTNWVGMGSTSNPP